MRIKVRKVDRISIKPKKSLSGYYLLIWSHYRVRSMLFLIPDRVVSSQIEKLLRQANGNFIDSANGVIPDATHRIRVMLSSWLVQYEVSNSRLSKKPLPEIAEVSYTGQIG